MVTACHNTDHFVFEFGMCEVSRLLSPLSWRQSLACFERELTWELLDANDLVLMLMLNNSWS